MAVFRHILKSKIHGATVTKRELNYSGSIGIDKVLLTEVDMVAGEKVQVLNFDNGARFETYIIEEKQNSRTISLYGPAARCGEVGDKLCIISYVSVTDEDIKKVKAKTVVVDEDNRITNSI